MNGVPVCFLGDVVEWNWVVAVEAHHYCSLRHCCCCCTAVVAAAASRPWGSPWDAASLVPVHVELLHQHRILCQSKWLQSALHLILYISELMLTRIYWRIKRNFESHFNLPSEGILYCKSRSIVLTFFDGQYSRSSRREKESYGRGESDGQHQVLMDLLDRMEREKKDEQSERAGLLHFSMDSAWPTFFIRLKRGNNRIYIFFIIIDLFVVEDVIFDSSVTSMAPF